MPDTCREFIPQNVFILEACHFMQKKNTPVYVEVLTL